MLSKLLLFIGLASAGLLFIILNITTPATAGAFGILAVFLLGYIATVVVVTFALLFIEKIIRKLAGEMKTARVQTHLTLKRAYYYASVIALAPVIFVSLQSVGGVGIYEVILVLFFVALGCVYITKRSR